MDVLDDTAKELRSLLGNPEDLVCEKSDGVWMEQVVGLDGKAETLLLIECGGIGIADRLRRAQRRSRELGVPLRVINGATGASSWAMSRGKSDGQKRLSPVPMMDLPQMDVWLERHYPRRKFFSVLY